MPNCKDCKYFKTCKYVDDYLDGNFVCEDYICNEIVCIVDKYESKDSLLQEGNK